MILTVSEDEEDLAAALRGGASGYLLKTIEGDALSVAVRRAVAGDNVIAQEMTAKLVAAFRNASSAPAPSPDAVAEQPAAMELSPRETEILVEIGQGASNKEIARRLSIAESTVKVHVQHLLRKLGVASRVHLAVIAKSRGLI